MQVKISFHNMSHSAPIEQHVREKLEKLHELLKSCDNTPPFFVEFWLKANKLHPHHAAELHLRTSIFDLHAHDEGTDLYMVIDTTIDTMVKLVKKQKDKQHDKHHKAETEKKNFVDKDDKYTLS
jgi:ribosomal subunit interface protein